MGFLGHNFSSRHARRSIKGFIDVADCLVSKTFELQKWLIGLATRARQIGSKIQEHVLFVTSPRKTPRSKQIIFFFNRTWKTCRICKGFGQLSSYRGWRVINKNVPPDILAGAVVKGEE